MRTLIYILSFTFFSLTLVAQEKLDVKLNGFVDSYQALRSKPPQDFLSSRNRLRTELQISSGKSYLFTSLNAVYNSILPEQTKIELREAFFQYTTENFDLKAGRQIITWGVSDGVRITDLISPLDYTEFLARDYDDIRVPVNSIRLKYLKPNYNFELVFVPVPRVFYYSR